MLDAMLDEALGGARPPDLPVKFGPVLQHGTQLGKSCSALPNNPGHNSHAKQVAAILTVTNWLPCLLV